MPYLVRRATPTDAETLIANNIAMARETENRELDPAVIGPGVRACLERPAVSAAYWLVEAEGSIVGQTMVTKEWSDWRNGWFWWIQSVFVDPDHRRRGVFRLIWNDIRREADERGDVIGIRLYVEKENDPARRTYENLGMTASDYTLYEIDWS